MVIPDEVQPGVGWGNLWSRGGQSNGFSDLLRWSIGRHVVPPIG